MPNYCENDLTIEGPPAEVQLFKEFAESNNGHIDFNKFIPYPQKFQNMDKARDEFQKANPGADWKDLPPGGYNSGGYDWCVKSWGTKWNALQITEWIERYRAEDMVIEEISFNTAWSPPVPVIEAMSKLFPRLVIELRYFEGGMGFNGKVVATNGEIEFDEHGPYFGRRGG